MLNNAMSVSYKKQSQDWKFAFQIAQIFISFATWPSYLEVPIMALELLILLNQEATSLPPFFYIKLLFPGVMSWINTE